MCSVRVFLLICIFAVVCVPCATFDDGWQYVLQEDADSTFHNTSSPFDDEDAVSSSGSVGNGPIVLRVRHFSSVAPRTLFLEGSEHPPQ